MSSSTEAILAGMAIVRDDELAGEVRSARANALLSSILTAPHQEPKPAAHRRRLAATALALGLSVLLASAALGVARHFTSFFAGWHDSDPPVPTASDVVLASGKLGVSWRLVATTSDRGLCLALTVPSQNSGSGGCGPTDVRGDPWAPHSEHWIGAFGAGGGSIGFTSRFAYGPLAAQVAAVDILLTNGDTLHAEVIRTPRGLNAPLNFYWAAWPCPIVPARDGMQECKEGAGPDIRMAIARDADGRVLERRVPIWNGNPTGDPDGPPPPLP